MQGVGEECVWGRSSYSTVHVLVDFIYYLRTEMSGLPLLLLSGCSRCSTGGRIGVFCMKSYMS